MAYFLGSIAAFLVQTKLIENFVMVFSCCRIAQLKTILYFQQPIVHFALGEKKKQQQNKTQHDINPIKSSRKEGLISLHKQVLQEEI